MDLQASLEHAKLRTRILFPDKFNVLDPNVLSGLWFYIETVPQGR